MKYNFIFREYPLDKNKKSFYKNNMYNNQTATHVFIITDGILFIISIFYTTININVIL